MATVGLSTRSITRLNGSVSPVSRRVSRCSITESNLEKRSVMRSPRHSRLAEEIWVPAFAGMTSKRSRFQLLKRVDELADGLDLGLHVHRDEDVELVFDIGDEIEDGEAVPLEVLGEARAFRDRDALLVEGLDELEDFGEGLAAVGHAGSVSAEAPLKQRNGARMRRFPANHYSPQVDRRSRLIGPDLGTVCVPKRGSA